VAVNVQWIIFFDFDLTPYIIATKNGQSKTGKLIMKKKLVCSLLPLFVFLTVGFFALSSTHAQIYVSNWGGIVLHHMVLTLQEMFPL